MGEIADGIINGDFDAITGEYLGEGGGFPRTRETEGVSDGIYQMNRPKSAKIQVREMVYRMLGKNADYYKVVKRFLIKNNLLKNIGDTNKMYQQIIDQQKVPFMRFLADLDNYNGLCRRGDYLPYGVLIEGMCHMGVSIDAIIHIPSARISKESRKMLNNVPIWGLQEICAPISEHPDEQFDLGDAFFEKGNVQEYLENNGFLGFIAKVSVPWYLPDEDNAYRVEDGRLIRYVYGKTMVNVVEFAYNFGRAVKTTQGTYEGVERVDEVYKISLGLLKEARRKTVL